MNLVGTGGLVTVVVLVAVLVVVALTATVLVLRARRLDRLHVRTDAARAALVAALDRRASVIRAIAATAGPVALDDTDRRALRAAAHAAEVAGIEETREAAENELARRLGPLDTAALPADLAAELADAHARVAVARRVHNDAVRDTRALRGRRMVRYLKLAGTAPVPRFFEIVEPDVLGAGGASAPAPARDAVRVVVLDVDGRVLLLQGTDPARPAESFWFTPGGGVGQGEDGRTVAARELTAATGLAVAADDLVGPLWTRTVVFEVDGVTYGGRELFLLARVDSPAPPVAGTDGEPERTVLARRWWTATELAATVDVVHPHQLAELLADPEGLDPARLDPTAPPTAVH